MSFDRRLLKLEQRSRAITAMNGQRGLSNEAFAAVRRIALTCESWQELAIALEAMQSDQDGAFTSLDEKCRNKAVVAAFARVLMDEIKICATRSVGSDASCRATVG